jgi:hypothetical protein
MSNDRILPFHCYSVKDSRGVKLSIRQDKLKELLETVRPYDNSENLIKGPLKLAFSDYKFYFYLSGDRYLINEENLNYLKGFYITNECLNSIGD